MTKYYPLTSGQRINFFSWKYSPIKSIVDICTLVHYDAELNEEILKQAIYLAILRNPSSKVRLHLVDKEYKQYFSDAAPEQIEILDYTDKTEDDLRADADAWSKIPFPNKSLDVQLYRVKLIRKAEGKFSIYFCVSHMLFDAFSLMAMVKDMMECYLALRDSKPLPPLKESLMKVYEEDWAYPTSKKHEKDYAFWENVYKEGGEPKFTSFNGYEAKENFLGKKVSARAGKTLYLFQVAAKHYNAKLDKEIVKGVNELAAELQVSPQVVYLLALRSMLSKVNKDENDISFMNSVARRSTLAHKRGFGTRVLAVFFRANIDNAKTSFRDACIEMQRLQFAYYQHANIDTSEVLTIPTSIYGIPQMTGYTTLGTTYQPYIDFAGDEIPTRLETFSTGANTLPLYLTIMALDNSGDLNFNYDYMTKFFTEETMKKTHEHVTKFLKAAIANPEMTLLELNHI
ncbi:MAG: hypothetical protein J6D00_03060 [Christensenellaceae bacterium]|nr:hypothetical protein [Christensenellaceae bacterium]